MVVVESSIARLYVDAAGECLLDRRLTLPFVALFLLSGIFSHIIDAGRRPFIVCPRDNGALCLDVGLAPVEFSRLFYAALTRNSSRSRMISF